MSFERTGYDGSAPWDFTTRGKSGSQVDNDQHYIILIKRIPQTQFKSSPSGGTALKNGIQRTDMRSGLQKRLDNHPVRGRNSQPNSITSSKLPATIQNSPTLRDAFFTMTGCIDIVIAGTDAASHALDVKLPRYMGAAGKVVGVLGLIDNGRQFLKDPNWVDGAQFTAQVALMVGATTLGAPAVFAGGVILFVWELAE